MTALNRRALLAGLAAATAAAATPAREAMAPSVESPALLELGDAIPAALSELYDAEAAYVRCVATWSPLWPAAPDAIRCDCRRSPARDFEGVQVEEGECPVYVMTVSGIESDIAAIRKAMARPRRNPEAPFYARSTNYFWGQSRTRHDWQAALDELTDLKAVAMIYEGDMTRIHAASDYSAVLARKGAAPNALASLVGEIMAVRPQTMEGLLVQAHALMALQHLDGFRRVMAALDHSWGADFAGSLVTLATNA